MDPSERLCAAVTPLVSICQPNVYQPDIGDAEDVYCTYNFNDLPGVFAEGSPNAIVYLVMLHLYAPNGRDCRELMADLAFALHRAGFTYPAITDASDKDGQHFVFECQTAEGIYLGRN